LISFLSSLDPDARHNTGQLIRENVMSNVPSFTSSVLAFAFLATTAQSALAAVQRTFVASNGSDANPCSLAAPCRSFPIAIARTAPGGEVVVQDSAGYGAATITQSVSIIAPPGVHAAVSGFALDGMIVNGVGIQVTLKGLSINGLGAGGSAIVFLQGAKLTVEDCELSNVDNAGINASAAGSTLYVRNTVIRLTGSSGVSVGGSLVAMLDGLHIESSGLYGIIANNGVRVTLANSTIANSSQAGVDAYSGSDVLVSRTIIDGGQTGIRVLAIPGYSTRAVADGVTINRSQQAAFVFSGGGGTELIYSAGNNTVGYNNGIVEGGALTPIGVH